MVKKPGPQRRKQRGVRVGLGVAAAGASPSAFAGSAGCGQPLAGHGVALRPCLTRLRRGVGSRGSASGARRALARQYPSRAEKDRPGRVAAVIRQIDVLVEKGAKERPGLADCREASPRGKVLLGEMAAGPGGETARLEIERRRRKQVGR